jgi:hypothetical protein
MIVERVTWLVFVPRSRGVLRLALRSTPMSRLSVPLNRGDIAQRVLEQQSSHPPANLPAPNPPKSFWINSTPDANPLATEDSDGTLTSDADI